MRLNQTPHNLTEQLPILALTRWVPLALLLGANALLLTPAGSWLRVIGAAVIMLMPGFMWARRYLRAAPIVLRVTVAAGVSYSIAVVVGLLLHYLPGAIPFWSEVVSFDVLSLAPVVLSLLVCQNTDRDLRSSTPNASRSHRVGSTESHVVAAVLLAILIAAAIFRFAGLGYSEFQGDEALAMITASQALEGHQDALFLRGKGPGEVLLPMMLWGLTGTVKEAIARLPFAIAGWMLVLTGFALARRLFSHQRHTDWIGVAAAGLFCFNGFLVAFSRIVQYQSVVMWMSALAVLCAWEWRQGRSLRWLLLSATFMGTGLLAHYDAILALPAVLFLVWSRLWTRRASRSRDLSAIAMAAVCLLIVAGLFYVPYALDPQASRTSGYLGDRIGDSLLKNNLADFQAFNVFYTSAYYYLITAALVLGFCAWTSRAVFPARRRRYLPALIASLIVVAGLAMSLWPNLLKSPDVDLAIVPFALILLITFLSPNATTGIRTAVLWLSVPFLGYNFGVALALTHIYTIVPAWLLIASAAMVSLGSALIIRIRRSAPPNWLWATVVALVLGTVFSGYLWIAYLRHSPEFRQNWPQSQPSLFWTPYDTPPRTGFFGFPHQTGWKGVGNLYASGSMVGDYISNEEPDVTAWYVRGAARACDDTAEYYFAADSIVDTWPVDEEKIEASHNQVGRIVTGSGKGLTLYQLQPTTQMIGDLSATELAPDFDTSAFPAAFASAGIGSHRTSANLGDKVELVGFDLDISRAEPGGRVTVTLFWRPLVSLTDDLHVFVHLASPENAAGEPMTWAQADGRPVCWSYPTFDWRPGQIIADHHSVALPNDLPQGDYELRVGMYAPETGIRLDVLAEDGTPLANFVDLAEVSIGGQDGDVIK